MQHPQTCLIYAGISAQLIQMLQILNASKALRPLVLVSLT